MTARVPCAVLSAVLLAAPSAARALAGRLDPSFGDGGKVTTIIPGGSSVATALTIQPDGKLVAAGYRGDFATGDFVLVRYAADGRLDPTFGTDGVVTTPITSGADQAHALIMQPDAKLVAAGFSGGFPASEFAVVRYAPDGSLDATFGSGGVATTAIGTSAEAHGAVLQPDGKVVLAGYAQTGGTYVFALARYLPDGTLDGTFGSAGTVTTPIGSVEAFGLAAILQPDGKVVVAGGADTRIALVRYQVDGTLDATFGSGGIVTTAAGASAAAAALVRQPDGKLVVAGTRATVTIDRDVLLVRYHADGTPDTAFGSGGVVTTSIRRPDDAMVLALQSDGKLVAGGRSSDEATGYDFVLVRYRPDGSIDASFGTGGVVLTSVGASGDEGTALVHQPDGKLVLAGGYDAGAAGFQFALARYLEECPVVTTTTSTTTTLPCLTPRCVVDAVVRGPCASDRIPAGIRRKLDRVPALLELAENSPSRKAAFLGRKARRLLDQAGRAAVQATRGKTPKLSATCGLSIKRIRRSPEFERRLAITSVTQD